MQYTLRNVPKQLDRALRAQAKREHKSLNEVLLAALQRALGIDGEPPAQRDLADVVGTWQDDPEQERVLAAQRSVDPELWK
jgi:plasmid stability protein